jgi:hypothetical protein
MRTEIIFHNITDCTSKIDQSNNISHTINMEKQKQLMQNSACIDCGILFQSSFDVQRHINNGYPMQEDDDSNESTEIDDGEDSSFDALIATYTLPPRNTVKYSFPPRACSASDQ